MAEFRKKPTGAAIQRLELRASPAEAILYFKADDRGKSTLACTSAPASIVEVAGVRVNDAPQGIRQVRIVPRTAGPAVLTASIDGKPVGTLNVKVLERLTLPPAETEAGMLARVFIAEASNPYEPTYDAQEAVKSMSWMHLVLYNRLRTRPDRFGAKEATLRALVTAKNQIQGLEKYPALDSEVERRIRLRLEGANDNTSDFQERLAAFVQAALDTARRTTTVPDPASPDALLYWRTKGATAPGGSAPVLFAVVAGNTFYKQKLPIE